MISLPVIWFGRSPCQIRSVLQYVSTIIVLLHGSLVSSYYLCCFLNAKTNASACCHILLVTIFVSAEIFLAPRSKTLVCLSIKEFYVRSTIGWLPPDICSQMAYSTHSPSFSFARIFCSRYPKDVVSY